MPPFFGCGLHLTGCQAYRRCSVCMPCYNAEKTAHVGAGKLLHGTRKWSLTIGRAELGGA